MVLKVVSLFSGCGGLDLGFSQAGFNIVYANDCDRAVWDTYEFNKFLGRKTKLEKRNIRDIDCSDIPDCLGIIGSPPCQSWSEAGAGRGIEDGRGQLFHEYIRIVREKQPIFFLAENVRGILAKRHEQAFNNIIGSFKRAGFNVSYKLLNALDYGVPQDRKRVFIVGIRKDKNTIYEFPKPEINVYAPQADKRLTLRSAIYDLSSIEPDNNSSLANHEYLDDSYSSIYMSRNRVRAWYEPSFTIQASGRHIPLHPQASKMIKVERDRFIFDPNSPAPYRRLSVRECARIQTFPDDFIFKYDKIKHGYKMVGNAVPVALAKALAIVILEYFMFDVTPVSRDVDLSSRGEFNN